MSKVSLPFWKNGATFEPVIYADDLANYEDAEDRCLEEGKAKHPQDAARARQAAAVPILREQAAFIARILEQSFPGEKADMRLTVAQTRQGFVELWTKGQDWRENDRPLGDAGGSSPASPLQASA